MSKKIAKTAASKKLVTGLAMTGLTDAEIAPLLEIGEATLQRQYRVELDNGRAKANGRVVANLFRIATSTNALNAKAAVTACIFWAKTRLGWRETAQLELKTPDLPQTVYQFAQPIPPPAPEELKPYLQ